MHAAAGGRRAPAAPAAPLADAGRPRACPASLRESKGARAQARARVWERAPVAARRTYLATASWKGSVLQRTTAPRGTSGVRFAWRKDDRPRTRARALKHARVCAHAGSRARARARAQDRAVAHQLDADRGSRGCGTARRQSERGTPSRGGALARARASVLEHAALTCEEGRRGARGGRRRDER